MAKAKESPARSARRMGVGLAARIISRCRRPACVRSSRARCPLLKARLMLGLAACLGGLGASPSNPNAPSPDAKGAGPNPLTLVRRTVCQDQGAWQVEYRFRNSGPTGLTIAPDEVAAKVEGWVSNSRVASHALPRWSSIAVTKGTTRTADRELIVAPEEVKRCKERLAVSIWPDDVGGCDVCPPPPAPAPAPAQDGASAAGSTVNLAPGDSMRVRLRLEHQHVVFGDYDPLLGTRAVELTIGPASVRDVVPLDREQYLARPRAGWPEIPADRRDAERFLSAPDSLHLKAHVPGYQYCKFDSLPVRYDTKMKLKFWYLIAEGTEGDCRLRLSQVRVSPASWRSLSRGNLEQCLTVVGRWTKVERIIRTDSEATHVAIEFGIINDTYIGEMWIDDVSFEPLETSPEGP